MTQKTNEELALEAGIPFNKYGLIGCDTCEQDVDDELDRFASLVEQRLIAKLTEGVGEPNYIAEKAVNESWEVVSKERFETKDAKKRSALYTDEQVAAAVLAERERCAKVCESAINSIWDYHDDNRKQIGTTVCTNLAAAIRGATT